MEDKFVKLLIAEDDQGHFFLMKKCFTRYLKKWESLGFINGSELLNFLDEQSELDDIIIILDINMPKLNGIETLRHLKKSEKFSKIPVIMFTTSMNPDEIEKCYNLGCLLFITKPIDYEEFRRKLKDLSYFISNIGQIKDLERFNFLLK